MPITQRLTGPTGAPLSLKIERLSTPGFFLDWTGATGTAPTVNVAACTFSATPAIRTLALVEAADLGEFPIQLNSTVLSQWTDGKYAFMLVNAGAVTIGGIEVDVTGGTDWTASAIPVAGGIVTACTPGAGGSITLSGYLPGPTGSYVPRKLYFTAGALATTETGACTAHVNNGGNSATFTFATAPTVATDGTAEAIVRGS